MDQEKAFYASYGGLGRVALMWGVPLFPFLAICFLSIFSAVGGMLCFGIVKGLIFPCVCVLVLLALKVVCEGDDRAIDRLRWKGKGVGLFLLSGKKVLFIGADFTSHHARKKNATRFFKENRC